MFFIWIVPLFLIGLIVYAVNGNNLVNAFKPSQSRLCTHCGQATQDDWKNCPHCGQAL